MNSKETIELQPLPQGTIKVTADVPSQPYKPTIYITKKLSSYQDLSESS